MGNKIQNGKARVHSSAIPFIGLSANSIRGLRHAFNDQLEGFGITKNKLVDMCEILSEQMAASENLDLEVKRLKRATKSYFKLLDTDKNKLIDAIGCLSGLALVSSMRRIDKIIFIMELFDFAQLNKLTSDECAMAMITGCGAVAVITSTPSPPQDVIETIAWRAFDHEGTYFWIVKCWTMLDNIVVSGGGGGVAAAADDDDDDDDNVVSILFHLIQFFTYNISVYSFSFSNFLMQTQLSMLTFFIN